MKNITSIDRFPALAAAFLMAAAASAGYGQSIFATVSVPGGIAADTDGNVFVETNSSNPFAPRETAKYTPYGSVAARYTTGSINGSRFTYDAAQKLIWSMEQSGQIRIMNATTGAVSNLLHLRQMAIDTSHIYNVNSGRTENFAGVIKTNTSWYGDIAVYRRATEVDIFVSGISDLGSFPFVVRVRILATSVTAQMIVASSASTEPYSYQPRGIAVNNAGTVLTSLPLTNTAGANTDFGFAIAADFDPLSGANPPRPLLGGVNGKGLGSHGMTADNTGRFYVAADLASSTVYCGSSVAAGVLVLPASLDSVQCLGGLPDVIDRNVDVAATSAGDAVYMTGVKLIGTQTGTGSVVKFTNVVTSAACSVTLNPTSRAHTDAAGTGTISVTAAGACPWAASASASWIVITAGAAGNGSGTVSYTVAANPNNTARQGTITVSGKTFTVTQAARAGSSCTYSLGPASIYMYKSGGTGSVTISTTAGCPWTATTDVDWITITSTSAGAGTATLTYRVAANASGILRTGHIAIAGKSAEVQQFNF